ncbi:MAG TPA: hypothetical protein VEG65_01035 [Candidatus Bathyarchaeia archaeon]|nr:hypothetical protein [Candidatus Bathyarchaeia archaeon]
MSDTELEEFIRDKIRQLGVDGLYDNPKLTLVAELIYGTLEKALEAALNYDVVDDIIALYRNRSEMTAISAEAEHPEVYNKAVNDYGSWRGALKAAKAKCEQMRAIEKDEWTFPSYKTLTSPAEPNANTDTENPTNANRDLL